MTVRAPCVPTTFVQSDISPAAKNYAAGLLLYNFVNAILLPSGSSITAAADDRTGRIRVFLMGDRPWSIGPSCWLPASEQAF